MKVLFLILASGGGSYPQFMEQWERYMNSNPSCECYFYRYSSVEELSGNTLFLKGTENMANLYQKTLDALKFFEHRLDEFDFICRPNLSSFFILDRYLQFLEGLPTTMCMEGVLGYHGAVPYPSGAGFSFTPDIAKILLKRQDKQIVIDDITFGMVCKEIGVQIYRDTSSPRRIDILRGSNYSTIIEQIRKDPRLFHVRLKQTCSPNRSADIINYAKLVDEFYGVPPSMI
jgi:hypothetical protein